MTGSDLITRLRTAQNTTLGVGALWNLCDDAADEIDRLREALGWYADKVGDCRKITREGDKARLLLHEDAGIRARTALGQEDE